MKKTAVSAFLLISSAALIYCGSARASPKNNSAHNFGVVKKGAIYRSAQPSKIFLERVIQEKKIKTVLNLRGHRSENAFEREVARRHKISLFEFRLRVENMDFNKVEEAYKFLADPKNHPILVHCLVGADRTGLLIALFRIREQNWPLEDAMKEMLFYWHDPKQLPRFQQYLKEQYFLLKKGKSVY